MQRYFNQIRLLHGHFKLIVLCVCISSTFSFAEAHPAKFTSRFGNKIFYARAGVSEYLTRHSKDLSKHITVEVGFMILTKYTKVVTISPKKLYRRVKKSNDRYSPANLILGLRLGLGELRSELGLG